MGSLKLADLFVVHQEVVLFRKSLVAMITGIFLDVGVSFKMLLEVALLRKSCIAAFNGALEWSFVCMASQVIEEFVQAWENLATIVAIMALK